MAASNEGRSQEPAIARNDVSALLKVAKGSLFVPILLLVLMCVVFIVAWLPSSRDVLADRFAMACGKVSIAAQQGNLPSSRKFTPLAGKCALAKDEKDVADLRAKFLTKNMLTENELRSFSMEEVGGPKGVAIVVLGAIKDYLDHVYIGISENAGTGLTIFLAAAAMALVPGIAGLIYRRAFWPWYLLAFAAILASKVISSNVLKLAGGAAPESVSDAAAKVFVLIVMQLLLIVLASRLRRHSTKPSFVASTLPPKVFNLILAVILAIAGFFILRFGWGDRIWESLLPSSNNKVLAKWNFVLFGLPFIYALLRAVPSWISNSPKNIVICLDGTSNTPEMREKGLLAQTNVFKLFKMLKSGNQGTLAPKGRFDATLCKLYGIRQIGFYYSGIGNTFDNAPVIDLLMQATGLGASGIIERAYLDLVRVWRPQDKVFIVGFSRGAASARILARAIDGRGVPESVWTLRLFGRHWTLWPSRNRQAVTVNVLGCWDTVGSFGVGKTIAGINFQQLNVVHDMSVPDTVAQAYHMVALDEDRQEFEPTFMEPDPIQPERIVEVWFPGTHAGVGGGFATDRLSDVPLDFLLREVTSGYCADGTTPPGDESWGLYLSAVNETNAAAMKMAVQDSDAVRIHPDPRGQMRTSAISPMFNYRPRKLPTHSVIHEAVFERMETAEPVYAPQALFDFNHALDARRQLIVSNVDKLGETKSLTEGERGALLAYTDKLRLTRWQQYWQSVEAARKPEPPATVLSNAEANS